MKGGFTVGYFLEGVMSRMISKDLFISRSRGSVCVPDDAKLVECPDCGKQSLYWYDGAEVGCVCTECSFKHIPGETKWPRKEGD